MFRVEVSELIQRSPEFVFNALTDHDNYGQFPGVDSGQVLEPGMQDRNGAGALRVVKAGPLVLHERITGFEPGKLMTYHIERARPLPVVHDVGEIRLSAEAGGTRVNWLSAGRIAIPVLGLVIDKVFERQVHKAFSAMLRYIGRMPE
ncbi:SRPBCC family protein [bacterium]|nr:SRPBCC family protein [bacterium]